MSPFSSNPFSALARLCGEPSVEEEATVEPVPAPWVHFIWYGTGAPDASNSTTPKKISTTVPGVRVTFWCLSKVKPAFERAFQGCGVEVRTVEGLLNAPAIRSHVDRRKLNQTLRFMSEHRGYAPAKDLLSFLAVATYGGFYFDANCVIEDWDVLGRALRKPGVVPRFVRLEGTMHLVPTSPSKQNDMELLMGVTDSPTVQFRETDMWAFYGPKHHDVFWKIAQHYLQRAEAFGMAGSRTTSGTLRRSLRNTFAEGDAHQKRMVAGALGVFSIITGMHWLQQHDAEYDDDTSAWDVEDVDDRTAESGRVLQSPANYWVPALGLSKAHGNSWT